MSQFPCDLHTLRTNIRYSAHTGPTSARSTLRRPDEIKWQEFLTHFRNTQLRHEKLRTVPAPAPPPFAVDMESASASGVHAGNGASTNANTKGGTSATTGAGGARPGLRRAFGAPPATASGSLAQQQSRAGSSKGGAGAAGGTTRSTTGSRGTSPRTSTAFPRKT